MLDRLVGFETGRIRIDTLIADLEGLLNAVQDVEQSWKDTFVSYWADLELARALAIDRESRYLSEDEARAAFDAAAQLKQLVLRQIDEVANSSDRSAAEHEPGDAA